MAELEKMTIAPCAVETNGDIVVSGSAVKFMINPASFKHNHSISYSKKKPIGSTGEDVKFQAINTETVSFDLVFDGTGVIPESPKNIKDEIDRLKVIMYNFDGKEHQPKPVRLSWGGFLFFGRLTSFDVDYTLFKPSGQPLRAKAALFFNGYLSKDEAALRTNRSSPDLTHLVEVQAGDTLPLLCHRIYRNPAYYSEVARINGLNSPQALRPGLKLKFPPLS